MQHEIIECTNTNGVIFPLTVFTIEAFVLTPYLIWIVLLPQAMDICVYLRHYLYNFELVGACPCHN